MIKAIAKLIYPSKLKERIKTLLPSGNIVLAMTRPYYGVGRILTWLAPFFMLMLILLPTRLEARQYLSCNKIDPSFAHIQIVPADYAKAAHTQPNAKRDDFISLPEIAWKTIYRYFGKAEPTVHALRLAQKESALAGQGNLTHLRLNKGQSQLRQCGTAAVHPSTAAAHPSTAALGSSPPSPSHDESPMNKWLGKFKVEPQFRQAAGVFVTLSKNGKTRACWGSVYPRESNIARETMIATLGALSKDYRFKPVSADELKDLKVQVTVVRGLEAVNNIKMINPFKDGLMVRSAGRGGVILPGEAVDAYYEFVLARLKAGIKPGEPCQIYRIRTEIYD